jgi:hypothetical protein
MRMTRRAALLLVVALTAFALPLAPAASAPCGEGKSARNNSVNCSGGFGNGNGNGNGGNGGNGNGGSSAGGGTGVGWNPGSGSNFQVRFDPSRTPPCWYMAKVEAPAGSPSWGQAVAASSIPSDTVLPCPAFDVSLAGQFDEVFTLPDPEPVVEPDAQGVAGMRVFLEIGGESTFVETQGPITLRMAVSEYTIDWGDGSPTTTTTPAQRGGPYPDGELWHVYDTVGRPVITVTAAWEGTFSLTPPAAEPLVDDAGNPVIDAETGEPVMGPTLDAQTDEPVTGAYSSEGEVELRIREVQAVRSR